MQSTRKRPKLSSVDLQSLLSNASQANDGYDQSKDSNIKEEQSFRALASDKVIGVHSIVYFILESLITFLLVLKTGV